MFLPPLRGWWVTPIMRSQQALPRSRARICWHWSQRSLYSSIPATTGVEGGRAKPLGGQGEGGEGGGGAEERSHLGLFLSFQTPIEVWKDSEGGTDGRGWLDLQWMGGG